MPGQRQRSTNAMPVWLADDNLNPLDWTIDYDQQKIFDGQAYTVSTGTQAVAAGSYLNIQLENPAASGVDYVFSTRAFTCNILGGNAPPEYIRWATTSTFPTGGTVVPIRNRITDAANASGTFTYQIGTTPPTGTASSSGFVPTAGIRLELRELVLVAPGNKLIYSIGGANAGMAAATRALGVFLFFTRARA